MHTLGLCKFAYPRLASEAEVQCQLPKVKYFTSASVYPTLAYFISFRLNILLYPFHYSCTLVKRII